MASGFTYTTAAFIGSVDEPSARRMLSILREALADLRRRSGKEVAPLVFSKPDGRFDDEPVAAIYAMCTPVEQEQLEETLANAW